ncbi:DeoR family transcriptional regulator [Pseudodesulfovibrio portus]|jgi:DeoR family glycerol-3-phosphate regulon repressor|uniref:DeoR/GlpR family transcriptional regulator n=1 Tax=Pseudodesulfovibrio portus TaxID=231439 RepID=A0ABN6RYC7_9BACT|nr:DeoR family transcriptional regulator [Pseudodesulfovibrio portus]BDQ34753.1 DeoR/GlpR family transcriptional regulator [Pseudodesulfovibrio portus]
MSGKNDTDSRVKHASVRTRHTQIVNLVREQGFVAIGTLAAQFNVTPQTIRRDINILSKQGRLQRHHGGAGPVYSTENVDYTDRKVLCLQEKQIIAKLVAKRIPNRSSLFINMGTTNEEVAKALIHHKKLRVITNNLNVAKTLSGNSDIEVIVTGGLVRPKDCGIVGEAAIDFIRQFKVDYGIIGISGVDRDGTLLDFDYREVTAARSIMDNSRKIFLVTDHTKFGRNAMVRLGNIQEVDAMFTDKMPPAELVEVMKQNEVELHVGD